MSYDKRDSTYILRMSKKIKAIQLLGGKCITCGNDNRTCLEFHHKNKDEKEHKIAVALTGRWSVLKKELDKCSIMCRNCHMEEHYPNANKLKIKILDVMNKKILCEKCGYDKNYSAIDFHHSDSINKKFSFRDIHNDHIFLMPLKDIVEEMEKCSLLCRNCHAMEHYDHNRFLSFEVAINKKVNSYIESNSIDWQLVRFMHKEGIKNIEIARKLGCTKSSITYILNKK